MSMKPVRRRFAVEEGPAALKRGPAKANRGWWWVLSIGLPAQASENHPPQGLGHGRPIAASWSGGNWVTQVTSNPAGGWRKKSSRAIVDEEGSRAWLSSARARADRRTDSKPGPVRCSPALARMVGKATFASKLVGSDGKPISKGDGAEVDGGPCRTLKLKGPGEFVHQPDLRLENEPRLCQACPKQS